MSEQHPQHRTLSQVWQDTLNELKGEKITLQQIADQLGTRAYGAFIVLLTIPNFIPGISLLSGILLFIYSAQMSMGIQRPWLPKAISRYTISQETLSKGLNVMMPRLLSFEHYIKPRLAFLSTVLAIRLMGMVIAFFALIILLPIPFSNLLPSVALLFMALGMLQKDGLAVLMSAILGLVYSIMFLWLVWEILLRFVSWL